MGKDARTPPGSEEALAESAGFGLVGGALGRDVREAARTALDSGAVFPAVDDPISVFRAALAESIRGIETHPRGILFRDFLTRGPYTDSGPIPRRLRAAHLSDDEVASVTSFVHSFMVNTFKGALAELLASGAVARLVGRLKREGRLPPLARVFAGDSVLARPARGAGWRKGADLHVLAEESSRGTRMMRVVSVAEVKSYFRSERRFREQIDRHVGRARRGLLVQGEEWHASSIRVGWGGSRRVIRIAVEPDDWLLPRSFRFRKRGGVRRLRVDPGVPSMDDDKVTQTGEDEWRITLRWSKEALSEAAYEMTFWYMGKVGEALYASPDAKPREWGEMTAAEAGRNAAKMMLYYAILRARNGRDEQRAVALYNAYGFGYALGMGYRNAEGRREMLWPRDLDEIARDGRTRDGCRIAG